MNKLVGIAMVLTISITTFAYIDGSIVVPQIQSASDPNFQSMATSGVRGSVFWIDIQQDNTRHNR